MVPTVQAKLWQIDAPENIPAAYAALPSESGGKDAKLTPKVRMRNDDFTYRMPDKIGPYDLDAVVEGDCRELIQELPDKSIDVLVTSPPIGANVSRKATASKRTRATTSSAWRRFSPRFSRS